MIVTPTPDVVLDVLEAADPVAQRQATAKLDALKPSDADFAVALDSQAGRAAAAGDAASGLVQAREIKAPASGEVYRKFEAFVLQVFVENMLPQQANDIFGKGTAGNIWRGMLAEQLGTQLAKGKGIGIAKQLASAHPPPRDGVAAADEPGNS
jgi:peptidoglycan hydrolase FlgJ